LIDKILKILSTDHKAKLLKNMLFAVLLRIEENAEGMKGL
jgi:hypothetical protein